MRIVARHLDEMGREGERSAPPQVAVLLLHLGGPVDTASIEGYYRRLWGDPELAPGGLAGLFPGRKIDRAWEQQKDELVRGYELIGRRSPALDLARSQALALENRLNRRPVMAVSDPAGAVVVRAAFCLVEPSIDQVLASLAEMGARRVVAVPLYPQACPDTSWLCLQAFEEALATSGTAWSVHSVPSYHDQPALLRVMVERTRRAIDLIPPDVRDDAFLLFAMHSPPSARAQGGIYLEQVEATAQFIMRAVGYDEERSAVAWVTTRAPVPYLAPTVAEFAADRGASGVKSLVVVPVSHVTDSFETLHELDIVAYQAAVEAGVKQFRRVPTLNADPAFIAALAALVIRELPAELTTQLASGG